MSKLENQYNKYKGIFNEEEGTIGLDFRGNNVHLSKGRGTGSKDCKCQLHKQTTRGDIRAEAIKKLMDPARILRINAENIAVDAIALMVEKHSDYGSSNITDAPGGALNGLSVRLHDKVARLNNLLSNNKTPNFESLEDTFVDIVNYAIIALLVMRGEWDNTK